MMLASRLELEADTILTGIDDEQRREHAAGVIEECVVTLRDHESRVPLAQALSQVVRMMERIETLLDVKGEAPNGIKGVVGSIDPRTWVGIILSILAATGAATGLDVAKILEVLP